MKKVYLIHGWEGNPENYWFPWLKKELEKRKFKVIVPKMPNPKKPEIKKWINELKKITPDKNSYLIGHSVGCQAIMRYLETLSRNSKVGGLIFVAGFFNLPYLKTNEEKKLAKPWLENPINTEKIKKMTDKIVAIFSDNDPHVSLSDLKLFRKKLNAKIIIEDSKGHFSEGVKELPVVLNEILKWQM